VGSQRSSKLETRVRRAPKRTKKPGSSSVRQSSRERASAWRSEASTLLNWAHEVLTGALLTTHHYAYYGSTRYGAASMALLTMALLTYYADLATRVVVVPHARLEVLVEAALLEGVDQQQLGRRAPAPRLRAARGQRELRRRPRRAPRP